MAAAAAAVAMLAPAAEVADASPPQPQPQPQPPPQPQLVPFPLLTAGYRPHTFNYYANSSSDPRQTIGFATWIEVFRKSIPTFQAHAASDGSIPEAKRQAKAQQFAAAFGAALDALLAAPTADPPGFPGVQPVSCLTLCALRERCLASLGYTDIFKACKDTENEAALQLLPKVLQQIDQQPTPTAALEMALRGVFAGNVFDLGAAASAQRYESGQGAGFHCALDQLLERPWVIDDLDAVLQRFSQQHQAYAKAVLFVDNAGADVVLGMLPFARELVKRGTQVVLAANNGPTINDVTAAELRPLLEAAAGDGVLADACSSGRLVVVNSGSDLPVIDVSLVSPELAAAAADADLVVFEGMGRGIETNLKASFRCDSLKLGMIKHPEVAACLPGGRLYDCVCKLDLAGDDAAALRLPRAGLVQRDGGADLN